MVSQDCTAPAAPTLHPAGRAGGRAVKSRISRTTKSCTASPRPPTASLRAPPMGLPRTLCSGGPSRAQSRPEPRVAKLTRRDSSRAPLPVLLVYILITPVDRVLYKLRPINLSVNEIIIIRHRLAGGASFNRTRLDGNTMHLQTIRERAEGTVLATSRSSGWRVILRNLQLTSFRLPIASSQKGASAGILASWL